MKTTTAFKFTFTFGVTISFELHTIHQWALTYPSTKCILKKLNTKVN